MVRDADNNMKLCWTESLSPKTSFCKIGAGQAIQLHEKDQYLSIGSWWEEAVPIYLTKPGYFYDREGLC